MSTELAEKTEKNRASSEQPIWLSGFLLLGVLVGILGSLLIAWGYHLEGNPSLIGLHFLGLNAGYVVAVPIAQKLLARTSERLVSLLGCAAGCGGLLALSFLAPPMAIGWRIGGLAIVGFAGGSLATALLHGLEPCYTCSPLPALNKSGIFLGAGCLLATVTTGVVYLRGWRPIETGLLALVPAWYFFYFLFSSRAAPGRPGPSLSLKSPGSAALHLHDLRLVAAVLFTLLLFVQFGNEWAIAGWLPLFLVHRLGSNPGWAILTLALYFLVLTVARLVAQKVLSRVQHRKLLVGATILAMLGYVVLSLTPSLAGAYAAIFLIGAGFGPIFPLVAENLDERFSYRPGFYDGIFSVAITGAMCAPWLLGYVDAFLGIRFVMLIPAVGSVAVLVLVLLIMLEAHLMREPSLSSSRNLL